MARRGGGESSNTGLVVALVFFVLATIGLGVGTYMGYGGKSEAEKQAKSAGDEKTKATKDMNEQRARRLALRSAMGIAQDNDYKELNGLKREFGPQVQQEVGAATRDLGAWNVDASDKPPKTYAGLVEELRKTVSTADAQVKAKDKELQTAKQEFEDKLKDTESRLKAAQDKLAQTNAALVAEQNRKVAGSDEQSKKIDELSKQVTQLKLELQDQNVQMSRENRKLQATTETYQGARREFSSRVGPLMEKLDEARSKHPEIRELNDVYDLLARQFEPASSYVHDQPKGEIVRVGANGLIYINLGSAEHVRPGLTFSVLPAGSTGRAAASKERKAAIEVVTVMDAHLSSAKVIDAGNLVRNPLLVGDLLFNPSWDPNQMVHIAIAGIIDLNGDGRDDTQDLIRQLRAQGVEVDAYLDLKDRTVKGAMNERTSYLVLGDRPVPNPNLVIKENNPLAQGQMDILKNMDDMAAKAKDLGVTRVTYRRFLAMIGYRLPKGAAESDLGSPSYLTGSGGTIKKTESDANKPEGNKEDRPK